MTGALALDDGGQADEAAPPAPPDAGPRQRPVICLTLVGYGCGGFDYSTQVRIRGDLAALRASAVTVCRNTKCYSTALGTYFDSFFKPHAYGGSTVVERDEPLEFPQRPDGGPVPVIYLTVDWETISKAGCNPWCNVQIAYRREPGETDADGDVYEVSFGRSGIHVRDIAKYEVHTYAGTACEPPLACFSYETYHLHEAPMLVR